MSNAINSEDVLEALMFTLRQQLSGGGCPTPGCIGECAIISPDGETVYGEPLYWAAVYIWNDSFNDSAKLASWFAEGGAESITVSHVLYDEDNGDRDGRTQPDHGRAWHVSFTLAADRRAAAAAREAVAA